MFCIFGFVFCLLVPKVISNLAEAIVIPNPEVKPSSWSIAGL
ncbi:hypothetical protein CGMCC3_g7434 [Colletotrichum fructicola]|nr:uncharacterized protein CGMCC3_g7434 [Colletotrichum fructicola]KAE9576433.1 hypothetical protein CGMCC3_g7434 [Colletotrichum fructicola]